MLLLLVVEALALFVELWSSEPATQVSMKERLWLSLLLLVRLL